MKPAAAGYNIRLDFAEIGFGPKAAPKKAPAATSPSAVPAQATPTPEPEPNLTGKRVFNVVINDKPVLTNFDIFAAAGARNKAVAKEFENVQPDSNGKITIRFQTGPAGQPAISGMNSCLRENKGVLPLSLGRVHHPIRGSLPEMYCE